ncbi:MAG TPA: lysophospholipid acyltransferase family protein [Trueperaceae bacterium]
METITRFMQRAWFFWLGRTAFLFYAKLFYGIEVEGAERVPRKGGLVVASNHFSSLDPPVLGVSVPREINFMAKKELFENRYLRALMLGLRAYPVDRSRSDMSAIKHSLRLLKEGVAVGIFAQGTRNAGDVEALDGASFLAIRAGVPLQPAAIWREGRRFHVRFGEPIVPREGKRSEMQALTRELMKRVNELLPGNEAIGGDVREPVETR